MESTIPNYIWFYWTGSDIPHNLALNVNKFKEINPNFRVNIITNDDEILKLASHDFPNIVTLFNKISIPTCKSDIMRLLLLYYYGGIYVDCNTVPYKSFDVFYENHKCFNFIISFKYATNDFTTRILFSKPKIPLLVDVLNVIQKNLCELYNKEKLLDLHSTEIIPYNILVLTGTFPFYEILGRNNEKNMSNIAYFDNNSDIVGHYKCKLAHHINFDLHWSNLQKKQRLFLN